MIFLYILTIEGGNEVADDKEGRLNQGDKAMATYKNSFFKSETTDDRNLIVVEIASGAEVLREKLPPFGNEFKAYLDAKESVFNAAWAEMKDGDILSHRAYHLAQAAYNVL